MRWLRSLLLSLVLALAMPSLALTAQSLPQILPGSDPLWQSLNQIALTLPTSYDSFMASLTGQVISLQASNQSLQETNEQLQTSNSSLMLKNADLTNSLAISQQAVVTSESKSGLLQKDLDASTQSITRAKADALVLERQNTLLKVGCVSFGVGLVAVLAYEGGRAVGWWK